MKKLMITLLCSFAMFFVWMLTGSQVQAAGGTIAISGFNTPEVKEAYAHYQDRTTLSAAIGTYSIRGAYCDWYDENDEPVTTFEKGKEYQFVITIMENGSAFAGVVEEYDVDFGGAAGFKVTEKKINPMVDYQLRIYGTYAIPEGRIDLTIPDCCIGCAPAVAKCDDPDYQVVTQVVLKKDGKYYYYTDDASLAVMGRTREEWDAMILSNEDIESMEICGEGLVYDYFIMVKKKDGSKFVMSDPIVYVNGDPKIFEFESDSIEEDYTQLVYDGKYSAVALPAKLSLSASTFYYDGKAKYPTVTVAAGNNVFASNCKTYSGAYFAITNKLTNKKPGTYTVKVTGKNPYFKAISKTYKIKIKPTKITKLSGGKKSFTTRFTKQAAKYITGYQIRYSLKSSMAKAKTATIKSYKTVTKKISRLKSKKKYYVQIRTYKTISGKKYYSGWSAKKTVKTK